MQINDKERFTQDEIEQYRSLGYVKGPRVLSDQQIDSLQSRIDDILDGTVSFPQHLMGETVEQSAAKGQLRRCQSCQYFSS